MKYFQSLSDVCQVAMGISKRNPAACVGVFQSHIDGKYYASFSSSEIGIADSFVAEYVNGELVKS